LGLDNLIPCVGFDVLFGQLAPERTLLKKSQRRLRESKPISRLRESARFRWKLAPISALTLLPLVALRVLQAERHEQTIKLGDSGIFDY
jgi:hypothetical protein